jgi:hypothetical protein
MRNAGSGALFQLAIGNWKSAMILFSRLLHNLNDSPAFICRQRPGLYDPHLVANSGAKLIMGHELRRAADVPSVLRMQHQSVYPDQDCFLHFVGSNYPDFLRSMSALTTLAIPGARRTRIYFLLLFFFHVFYQ